MSTENTVQAKVLRPFEGDEGFKSPGQEIEVSRQRFADLKANGLVEEVGEKAAAKHEDKSAPTPANKAATTPKNK